MKRFVRGEGLNTRYVCDILPQTEPAEHLLVVEVRHARRPFVELSAAQARHRQPAGRRARSRKPTTTGWIRRRASRSSACTPTTARSTKSLAVENHDVVMVPRGYHPVVVPYGYESYYLNVMAGPKREWYFKNDPAHEWMLKPR